jgi:putative membrane protein
MMTKPLAALGVAAALAFGGAALAQTSMPQGVNPANKSSAAQPGMPGNAGMHKASKADQAFMKAAIEIDLAEIQVGELAQQKSQDQDVKQFGQMLQQDHSQNLQQAQQLAQQAGVTPPTAPNAKQKQMYEKLSKLSGSKFDKQFAKDMVKGHKEAIGKFQKEAKRNGPLAQFAQQTLPVLQKHLQTAQSIENKGAMTGSGSKAK